MIITVMMTITVVNDFARYCDDDIQNSDSINTFQLLMTLIVRGHLP